MTSDDSEMVGAAAGSALLRQVVACAEWVGGGRKLTQTGRLTLADARHLVELLGTGDRVDPKIGDRVYRTKSSEDLPGLTLVLEWAKAVRLVRVHGGRLVQVKKNASLLGQPVELWEQMFGAFARLGGTVCPSGWFDSLVGKHFDKAVPAVLAKLYGVREGGVRFDELCALATDVVSAGYVVEGTPEQLTAWRGSNDRDVRRALEVLRAFAAVRFDEPVGGADSDAAGASVVMLTELGRWSVRRSVGDPAAGEAVLQIRITLADTADPVVWRRLVVPAAAPLDRLHEMIQVAMGWENYHLHVFSTGPVPAPLGKAGDDGVQYGTPDPELGHHDEREARLGDLLRREGSQLVYTYDFGDDWEHHIILEATLAAAEDQRYPVCLAGQGACPPEDCGGSFGYERLREVLADPGHDEHESILDWLGIDKATEFDPAEFDPDKVTRELLGATA